MTHFTSMRQRNEWRLYTCHNRQLAWGGVPVGGLHPIDTASWHGKRWYHRTGAQTMNPVVLLGWNISPCNVDALRENYINYSAVRANTRQMVGDDKSIEETCLVLTVFVRIFNINIIHSIIFPIKQNKSHICFQSRTLLFSWNRHNNGLHVGCGWRNIEYRRTFNTKNTYNYCTL